jgi:hypothetical protein
MNYCFTFISLWNYFLYSRIAVFQMNRNIFTLVNRQAVNQSSKSTVITLSWLKFISTIYRIKLVAAPGQINFVFTYYYT